mgnify:CR=1 FL=1
MNKYITSIIIAVLLVGSTNVAQADHHGDHSKTNKVSKAKAKPTPKKAKPTDARTKARKAYVEAAKKIKEAVEAGKLTEEQAKEKYAALRKRMATRSSRADILKRFDKNKDGKLDDKEKAAARKAMSERKKSSGKRGPKRGERGGNKKRERRPRRK